MQISRDKTIRKADILHVAAHDMMILAADAVVPLPTRHVRSSATHRIDRRKHYEDEDSTDQLAATPFDMHVVAYQRPRTPQSAR